MPNRQVKIGVSAKDLEEQGVRYDSAGFLPQLPDYLGYVLGLLLIWLVYTAYTAAVETAREPIAKISEQAEEIKEKVEVITASKPVDSPSVATELEPADSKGWWFSKLESINQLITWAADSVSYKVQEMFPPSYEDEPMSSSRERRHRGAREQGSF